MISFRFTSDHLAGMNKGYSSALTAHRLTVGTFTNVNLVPFTGGVFNPPAYPSISGSITPATLTTVSGGSNNSVSMTWNNVSGQTESGYIIERSEDNVNWKLMNILGPTTFSYTDNVDCMTASVIGIEFEPQWRTEMSPILRRAKSPGHERMRLSPKGIL